MRSEFYKHGYDQGLKGEPIYNSFEIHAHKHDFEEGWFVGICERIEQMRDAKRAKDFAATQKK